MGDIRKMFDPRSVAFFGVDAQGVLERTLITNLGTSERRKVFMVGVTVTEGILNRVEMAFRLYDPCFGCATHTLPGQMPLTIRIHDSAGELKEVISR